MVIARMKMIGGALSEAAVGQSGHLPYATARATGEPEELE